MQLRNGKNYADEVEVLDVNPIAYSSKWMLCFDNNSNYHVVSLEEGFGCFGLGYYSFLVKEFGSINAYYKSKDKFNELTKGQKVTFYM
jgi:hypothetical protein